MMRLAEPPPSGSQLRAVKNFIELPVTHPIRVASREASAAYLGEECPLETMSAAPPQIGATTGKVQLGSGGASQE
jgi:hypothetical protein